MRLNDEESLFEAIEIFESKFIGWLKGRLHEKGIEVKEDISFQEMLRKYEDRLNGDRQHVNPLMNWAKEKSKCLELKALVKSNQHLDKNDLSLLEKTAMNGAVLLLTFQTN